MYQKNTVLNLTNLDSSVVKNIKDIRMTRLTIARRQLEHLEKTAQEIRSLPSMQFANNDFSLPELRKVLVDKINLLEKRAVEPFDVFPDEMNLALEMMQKGHAH